MEKRKPSIMDKITPLQGRAWEAEHFALEAKVAGSQGWQAYHLAIARDLRTADTKNRISELFNRLDAQNALLDGIAEAKGNIPLVMEPGVDYSLIQQ